MPNPKPNTNDAWLSRRAQGTILVVDVVVDGAQWTILVVDVVDVVVDVVGC